MLSKINILRCCHSSSEMMFPSPFRSESASVRLVGFSKMSNVMSKRSRSKEIDMAAGDYVYQLSYVRRELAFNEKWKMKLNFIQ